MDVSTLSSKAPENAGLFSLYQIKRSLWSRCNEYANRRSGGTHGRGHLASGVSQFPVFNAYEYLIIGPIPISFRELRPAPGGERVTS
jgi:hypothetical protein